MSLSLCAAPPRYHSSSETTVNTHSSLATNTTKLLQKQQHDHREDFYSNLFQKICRLDVFSIVRTWQKKAERRE